MKVLQVNTTYNIGSTGRIVAGIDNVLKSFGVDSYCAFGYGNQVDDHHYKIINWLDSKIHNFLSRLSDSQGLHSSYRTKLFIDYVRQVNPDIVHLHNLHGNYLNIDILFKYLQNSQCKVVWTLHDCWPFTGHCAYFDLVQCEKWKTNCYNCPQIKAYPSSLIDNCMSNFKLRKKLFTSLGNRLVLVPVSYWLAGLLKESFFNSQRVHTIHNGINLANFKRIDIAIQRPYILGVAASWDSRKGFQDFIKLRKILDKSIDIVLVGLSSSQISKLPEGIKGIQRTSNVQELAKLYSGASVFVNTTYEDNYPTVNLESIACGTPVITYNTGGSPESVMEGCGVVIPQGDISLLQQAIIKLLDYNYSSVQLENYAAAHFNENDCFRLYYELYKSI